MTTAVSHATQAQPVARTTTAPAKKAAPAKPAATPKTDTAQLSQAAQAALAAIQEATETPAQTAQEAARGDVRAQHLLAKETAAKSASK